MLYHPQHNVRTSFANLTFEGRSVSLALFKRSQSLWQMPHWQTVSIFDNSQCNTRMTTRLLIVKRLFPPPRRWESTRLDFPSPWQPAEIRRVLDEKKRICNEATSLEKLISALKESVESLLLIEMHLLFTFADPLFEHYAWFFEIEFSVEGKNSPLKVDNFGYFFCTRLFCSCNYGKFPSPNFWLASRLMYIALDSASSVSRRSTNP